jgi:hypothetical protein
MRQTPALFSGAYATAGVWHPTLFKKVSEDHVVALENKNSYKSQELSSSTGCCTRIEIHGAEAS